MQGRAVDVLQPSYWWYCSTTVALLHRTLTVCKQQVAHVRKLAITLTVCKQKRAISRVRNIDITHWLLAKRVFAKFSFAKNVLIDDCAYERTSQVPAFVFIAFARGIFGY